jgi:hypothetical protein
MSALNANTTFQSYLLSTSTMAFVDHGSKSTPIGTIIFGVIASVMALIVIIIGILQLRKTEAHRQMDESA